MRTILILVLMVSAFIANCGAQSPVPPKEVQCPTEANFQRPQCTAEGFIAAKEIGNPADLTACNIYYYCLEYAPRVFIAYRYNCDPAQNPTKYFEPISKTCRDVEVCTECEELVPGEMCPSGASCTPLCTPCEDAEVPGEMCSSGSGCTPCADANTCPTTDCTACNATVKREQCPSSTECRPLCTPCNDAKVPGEMCSSGTSCMPCADANTCPAAGCTTCTATVTGELCPSSTECTPLCTSCNATVKGELCPSIGTCRPLEKRGIIHLYNFYSDKTHLN